jgi:hypothetical protein
MSTAPVAVRGVVRGGVVVPEATTALPEGAQVTIFVGDPDASADLAAEFAAWERASEEAWSLIEELDAARDS